MARYLLFAWMLFPMILNAQILSGAATQWSDSFRDWYIYGTDEEKKGEMRLRWSTGNDWTEWNYQLEDHYGNIRIKWRNNPNEWEVRGENVIVSVRTVWNNNFRDWRISGPGNRQLNLKCKFGNQTDEWLLSDDRYGHFEMYTNWEGDPRDWAIIDELSEEVTFPERMALVFIVLFHSSPRE